MRSETSALGVKKFSIILASDSKNWIWKENTLSWKISEDIKYFKKITKTTKDLAKHNAVIMWRKTWDSIPWKFRPLSDRINCILSRTLKYEDMGSKIDNFVLHFNNFNHCLEELEKKENIESIFLVWWWSLYNQFINHTNLDKIYLTKIEWDFECDIFFDWIPNNFIIESYTDTMEENWIKFSFWVYKKVT